MAERSAIVNAALKQWRLSLHITRASRSDLYMECVYPCFREALEFRTLTTLIYYKPIILAVFLGTVLETL